jgi:D-glycero-alpha-D-manno-heptose-7-phosphate kinase
VWLPSARHETDTGVEEVETTCPVRVSLGGGGTDVLTYAERFGSEIVSVAVDRPIGLRIRRRAGRGSHVRWSAASRVRDSPHPLALIDRVLAAIDPDCGYDVRLSSDRRFGSGLGTSSALVVSLLLAMESFHGAELTPTERAATAYVIEREMLGEAGGFQDQLAAAVGGGHHYRFSSLHDVRVERLSPDLGPIIDSMVLLDSGIGRNSADALAGHLGRLAAGRAETLRSLHRIRRLVPGSVAAIRAGDVHGLAACVRAAWSVKATLDPGLRRGRLGELLRAGRDAGALAGRVLGAGAGGHLIFLAPPGKRAELISALAAAAGPSAVPVTLSESGARVRYRGTQR